MKSNGPDHKLTFERVRNFVILELMVVSGGSRSEAYIKSTIGEFLKVTHIVVIVKA